MNKITSIVLSVFIAVGVLISGAGVALATDYCAGSLSGWWAAFYPNDSLCDTSYYTYNTTSLGGEESWFKSDIMYSVCGKSTPPWGPTYYYDIGSREYIPSPDTSQTNTGAHYYRWGVDDSYAMVGDIAQYSTYGWGYNYTTTWNWHDAYKLSDWTHDSLYSKHVDLDAFSITNCP